MSFVCDAPMCVTVLLQCVCSVLQRHCFDDASIASRLFVFAVCLQCVCSVLQCVAVFCSVLQCVAVCCGVDVLIMYP